MRRFTCLSNRTTLAAPIVGGALIGLAASYRSTISADTIDVPWDGQGECPIAHPFGTGINRLDKAIRHAEETDDLASVQRLYQFVLAHMHKEFTLVDATVTVHHASHQWSGPQRAALNNPDSALADRWNDTYWALANGDRRYTPMRLNGTGKNPARLAFCEKRPHNAPLEWTFGFAPKQ
ncbi:hypothetical protein TW95_gp0716 [Pandoravirus inopinatum]|uniref:Uncharacterized protein n=1 Tax=Pandoravirus inopinatum TaxID=1605721 RepID=A0A0B5J6P8_9VIRU|nr:hypothetical protein TW95_gp0716 [Pandoravirus inopinatum]AJF97450.1 hypothetical protein [Pandoravirus inopinatum]